VYVGDRLYDDIHGARGAGLRAIHVPHSTIPVEQVGPVEGDPDAVVHELADIVDVLTRWRSA
jgi:putative hydrolase of the HAD superfamily